MNGQDKSFERVNQKQRTRAELLRAAGELVEQGLQPSVADVADHAKISRATAYRYFSKSDDLLREASLDAIARAIQPDAITIDKFSPEEPNAVRNLVSQVFNMVVTNEAMFRTFLANSITGEDIKRGGRRLGWLRDVLEPLNARVTPNDYDRLVFSLSLLTGIETIVVLKDVCGLDNKAAEDVIIWAADTLVAGATFCVDELGDKGRNGET